jgi:MerR family transcriptional regulator/heat shock protein HspR
MYERPRTRTQREVKISDGPPPLPPKDTPLAQPEGQQETSEEATVQIEGVYIISVAARLLDVHPQTLRKYERLGLINPGRTMGMLRLYSWEDLRRVRLIQHLSVNLGLNLAGVEFALSMVDRLLALRQRLNSDAEGTPFQDSVDQEVISLFQDMGLPLED